MGDSFLTIGVIMMFFVIIGIPAVVYIGYANTKYECSTQIPDTIVGKQEILSLSDNSNTQGSFIWGSGSVRSVPSYAGYTQREDGSYHITTYKAELSDIFMDLEKNSTKGYVIEHERNSCIDFGPLGGIFKVRSSHYDIHIPEGSILKQFKLDGEL